jgi:hypothetical protein
MSLNSVKTLQTPLTSLPSGSSVAVAELPTRGHAAASGHPQQRRKFVDEGKFRKVCFALAQWLLQFII